MLTKGMEDGSDEGRQGMIVPFVVGHILDQLMADYLAMPALSASVLKALLDECPRAAWHRSWLNPHRARDTNDAMDLGTLVHSMLLEGHIGHVEVIDPVNYKGKQGGIPKGWTNDAIKAARDAARAAGKIPVLPHDMAQAKACVASARLYIESLKDTEPAVWAALQPGGGDSEVTVAWQDGPTPCRIRPDRISTQRDLIVDVKSTATSANPMQWVRQLLNQGGDVSAAFYNRGCQATFGVETSYKFLVVETVAPFLTSLIGIDPHGVELGREKVQVALDMWQQCVARNSWPAYPNRACYPEVPAWEDSRWAAQQESIGLAFYEAQFGDLRKDAAPF